MDLLGLQGDHDDRLPSYTALRGTLYSDDAGRGTDGSRLVAGSVAAIL